MVNSTFGADLQTSVRQGPTFADTAPQLELLRNPELSKSYSPSYSAFNTQMCAHKWRGTTCPLEVRKIKDPEIGSICELL